MVVLGVNAHKRTDTVVATDELGRKLGEKTVAATSDGHLEALEWARRWPERSWALEDCRHVSRRLESDLLVAGEAVIRVPAHLMAGARRSGREQGKSDPIDALAVARAALREESLPSLGSTARPGSSACSSIIETTWSPREPGSRVDWLAPPRASSRAALAAKGAAPPARPRVCPGPAGSNLGTVARIAPDLVGRTRELTLEANRLEREIIVIVRRLAPSLLELAGCGALSAAKIMGDVAGADRFRSKAAFARWNGTAPIPVSSRNSTHVRLSRRDNRQVNATLHRIPVTQWHGVGTQGRAYIERRMTKGHQDRGARLLRRRLDELLRRLHTDQVVPVDNVLSLAA